MTIRGGHQASRQISTTTFRIGSPAEEAARSPLRRRGAPRDTIPPTPARGPRRGDAPRDTVLSTQQRLRARSGSFSSACRRRGAGSRTARAHPIAHGAPKERVRGNFFESGRCMTSADETGAHTGKPPPDHDARLQDPTEPHDCRQASDYHERPVRPRTLYVLLGLVVRFRPEPRPGPVPSGRV